MILLASLLGVSVHVLLVKTCYFLQARGGGGAGGGAVVGGAGGCGGWSFSMEQLRAGQL